MSSDFMVVLRRCRRKNWKTSLRNTLLIFYLFLVIFALFNGNSRCREEIPWPLRANQMNANAEKMCRIDTQKLGIQPLNIFEQPELSTIEHENPSVKMGGMWKPSDCEPLQSVAILIPYRDRWNHLKLLMKRLHPLLRRQKVQYRIYVIEQSGHEQFNRGRLMNIGVLEALKRSNVDCFVFHDVDLLPENDLNIYYCNEHAHHLASAIDEMRYHVMYYNYAGGVIAINKENVFRINGYSNNYWGWGSEDDDLSARTMGAGLLLTRPPENLGRYKMIRHHKSWRAENGYGLFLSWRSRWKTDGLNSLDDSMYKIVKETETKLFTMLTVNIGLAPKEPPDIKSGRESIFWFLTFFFP